MQTSVFIAKLAGPVMLVAAIGLLINAAAFRAMAHDVLRSPPLLFISGVLAMTAGLAIVLNNNVWTADWRVILTLFGWAATIGGAARIALPDRVRSIGDSMLSTRPWVMKAGGMVWLVIGAVLCFYGYFH